MSIALASKVRRKVMEITNRLRTENRLRIKTLDDLLSTTPTDRGAADRWASQATELINDLVLDRITKEDIAMIFAGLVLYRKSGVTPHSSQMALIRAFENSSGLFQEVLQRALFDPESVIGDSNSALFGRVPTDIVERIVQDMNEEGYSIYPQKIDIDLVEKIRSEATNYSYRLIGGAQSGQTVVGVDPKRPPNCISAYANPPTSPTWLCSSFKLIPEARPA